MTIRACLSALCLALGFASLSAGHAYADKRIALLIGNSSYRGVTKLENPPRDVAALSAAFQGAGFDKVDTKLDLDRDAMVKALRSFEDDAASADIAVIYFSGHGLEMNGENFLVPIDAKLAADRDVEDETVTLSRMLRTVDGAKRLKLIILDACRNNPFLANMSHARSTKAVSRGLVEIEPRSADTLVAYAAKAGTVAWDGAGDSSPFAQSLARRLIEPGLDIRLALGKVRDDVLASTNSLQEPFAYGSLGGSTVSLAQPAPVVPVAIAIPASAPALQAIGASAGSSTGIPTGLCTDAAAHWAEASRFNRLDFYRKHVELFGNCAFGDFARAKVLELEQAPAAAGAEATPDAVAAIEPVVPVAATPVKPPAKASSSKASATKSGAKSAAAKSADREKRIAKRPQKRVGPADGDDAMSREPVEVEAYPAPRRSPSLLLGFGRPSHGGIGFGGGSIGVGW